MLPLPCFLVACITLVSYMVLLSAQLFGVNQLNVEVWWNSGPVCFWGCGCQCTHLLTLWSRRYHSPVTEPFLESFLRHVCTVCLLQRPVSYLLFSFIGMVREEGLIRASWLHSLLMGKAGLQKQFSVCWQSRFSVARNVLAQRVVWRHRWGMGVANI